MNDLIVRATPTLPSLPATVLPALEQLVQSLGIPRNALASAEEIEYAWRDLPRELREIPEALRGELIARMCVAVSTGLFDGAMNYIWNAAILHLRDKIRVFGLPVVAQIRQNDFEEKHLLELQDSRLLELCLKLNIIDEDGFFFLDQCRDVRNNFSAAHPTLGKVNDREFTTFLNRCVRYALADSASPKGVDIGAFISAVKGPRFNNSQCGIWIQRLTETHDAQRQMLVTMVHGIYCDPASNEEARVNALMISGEFSPHFTPKAKSDLINRHHDYIAKGDEKRHKASQQFFEKLGILALLGEHELHSMISGACKRMFSVHQAFDNFYNEPAFAERLLQLSSQGAIPDTVKDELVATVITCAVGNPYGVSHAAMPYYVKMIQGFSPREVEIMLNQPTQKNIVGERIKQYGRCKGQFKELVKLIDPSSVSTAAAKAYNYWMK